MVPISALLHPGCLPSPGSPKGYCSLKHAFRSRPASPRPRWNRPVSFPQAFLPYTAVFRPYGGSHHRAVLPSGPHCLNRSLQTIFIAFAED